MAAVRQYDKYTGTLIQAITGTVPNGQACWLGGGYFLANGRNISLWYLDGSSITKIQDLHDYGLEDYEGTGICVDMRHVADDAMGAGDFSNAGVYTTELYSGGGLADMTFSVWNWTSTGTLKRVEAVNFAQVETAGCVEFTGRNFWRSYKFLALPSNTNRVQSFNYTAPGVTGQNFEASFGKTHGVTDLCFDGRQMWRLRSTVPELVSDVWDGTTRDAQIFITPAGSQALGVFTNGQDLFVLSRT